MTLTTRLSAYFLSALALVLLGFSLFLFVLVRDRIVEQANQRVELAMQTVIAAVEVHAHDVEWEPLERHITFGEDSGEDKVRWMVHNAAGQLVDCSRNLEQGLDSDGALADLSSDGWRVLVRRLSAGRFESEPVGSIAASTYRDLGEGIAPDQLPGQVELPTDRTFRGAAVTLRVGLPWRPVATAVRRLAWTLVAVSTCVWCVGVLFSRRVCRQAIRPVVEMALCAKTLRGDQPGQLLPVASTGDEVEDLGHSFNDLLARLQEVLQQQQRFAGDASHQLRTPLTAVLGQVEVALRQERSPQEYQRVLQIVRRRAGEMRQMVELLLFLARMPARSEPPDTQIIDLASWLEEHQRHWQDHPRAGDISWPSLETASGWEIRTQPALLGQLVDNLLDNACKYSEANTSIRMSLEREWRGVTLTVADEGRGISAEDLPHLCDPFYRSAEARRLGRPGVGLGLTVVQRIVTVLGGELRIDSKPGRGSRFSFYLPAVCNPTPASEKGIENININPQSSGDAL